MRMLRALLTMTLVLGGAVSMTAAHAEPESEKAITSFSDVPGNHTFKTEIDFLAGTGITTGYADGTFRPSQPVLREQMAAFLFRLAEYYVGTIEVELPPTSPFVDVSPSHAFYKEMVWLRDLGITTGYADGTFRPSQPVLREQMSAFLCRFDSGTPCTDLEVYGVVAEQVFFDVPPSHTFFNPVYFMAGLGISTGYDDGTFRPSQPVLREQMAAFLYRYDQAPTSESTLFEPEMTLAP